MIFAAIINIHSAPIDALFNWWIIIKDLVLCGAAIITAVTAIRALNSWRGQQVGKARFDAARELLALAYQVREKIRYIRAPLWRDEAISALREMGQDQITEKDIAGANGLAAVYQVRWDSLADLRPKLHVARNIAEVYGRAEIKNRVAKLETCMAHLLAAMQATIIAKRIGADAISEESADQLGVLDDILQDHGTSSLFTARVDQAVLQIEEYLQPWLDCKRNLTQRAAGGRRS